MEYVNITKDELIEELAKLLGDKQIKVKQTFEYGKEIKEYYIYNKMYTLLYRLNKEAIAYLIQRIESANNN